MFYFHPYLGKISSLTNIFQMGWNHQPDNDLNYPTMVIFLIFTEGDDRQQKTRESMNFNAKCGMRIPHLLYGSLWFLKKSWVYLNYRDHSMGPVFGGIKLVANVWPFSGIST